MDFSQPFASMAWPPGRGVLEAVRQHSYVRIIRHALYCPHGCYADDLARGVGTCLVGLQLYQQAIADDAAARLGQHSDDT